MVSQAELEQIRFQQLLDFQKQLYQQFQDFQSKNPVVTSTSPPREAINHPEIVSTKSQSNNMLPQRHELPCSRGTNKSNVYIPQYSNQKQRVHENVPQRNHVQCRRNVNPYPGTSKSVKENENVVNIADLMNHFKTQQPKNSNPTLKNAPQTQNYPQLPQTNETRPVIDVEEFLKQLGINLNQYEQKDNSKQVPKKIEQNQKPVKNDKPENNFCSNIQNLVNSFARNMAESAHPRSETVEKKSVPQEQKNFQPQSVPVQEPVVKSVPQSKPVPVPSKPVPVQPQSKVEEEPESVKSFKKLESLAEQVESIISNISDRKKKEIELMKILLELDSISCSFVLRPIRKSLVETINKELDSLQKEVVSSEIKEESPKEEISFENPEESINESESHEMDEVNEPVDESVNESVHESSELSDAPNELVDDVSDERECNGIENQLESSPSNLESENESSNIENAAEDFEESSVPVESNVEDESAPVSNEEENLTFGLIAPYMTSDNAPESEVSPTSSEAIAESEIVNEEGDSDSIVEERDEVVEEKSEHEEDEDVLIEDVEDDDDSFESTETVNTNNLVESGFVFVGDTPGNPDENDETQSIPSDNILNDSLPVLDEVQA